MCVAICHEVQRSPVVASSRPSDYSCLLHWQINPLNNNNPPPSFSLSSSGPSFHPSLSFILTHSLIYNGGTSSAFLHVKLKQWSSTWTRPHDRLTDGHFSVAALTRGALIFLDICYSGTSSLPSCAHIRSVWWLQRRQGLLLRHVRGPFNMKMYEVTGALSLRWTAHWQTRPTPSLDY